MANRFSQISTSSFKPLSLEEIMAVPLARQAQHDASQLALDEFAKLEANSLDADKEYVAGQINAFRRESDDISNQLLDSGVDRNLKNKIRSLRSRKDQEFSLMGKTGQASAAYNQFKANEKEVMARKDLTAEQKERGLARAKSNYLGVAEGGTYQDYVGTSHIDIMKRGQELASKMTPEEIAKSVNMVYDPETGYYSNGTYKTRKLDNEHIQRVIYNALKGDRLVTDYAGELQDLGIESDADKILKDSAIAAGNIFQQNSEWSNSSLSPQFVQPTKIDPTQGLIDIESQQWRSMDLLSDADAAAYSRQYNALPPSESNILFTNGSVINVEEGYEVMRENEKKELDMLGKLYSKGTPAYTAGSNIIKAKYETSDLLNKASEAKGLVAKLRENYPSLNDPSITDQQIYNAHSEAVEKSMHTFAQTVFPTNPKHTFTSLGANLLGSGTSNGTFASRNALVPGMESGSTRLVAENLGMELPEFNAMVRNGQFMGMSLGLTDMPGAYTVQVTFPEGHSLEGQSKIIYFKADNEVSREFDGVSDINKAIIEGVPYKHKRSGGMNEHVMVRLVPGNEENNTPASYEGGIFRSAVQIPQDALNNLEFTYYSPQELASQGIRSSVGMRVAKYNGHDVYGLSLDEEIQRVNNKVTRYYDKGADQAQVLTPQQKN